MYRFAGGERKTTSYRDKDQTRMRVQERQKDKAPRISKHLETELVNCQVMNDLIFGKKE